jgi:CRISPR-associated endonuclease/helicase Cas3
MQPHDFPKTFQALTGSSPFPWQSSLFAKFIAGDIPASAAIPTGLGKTSIIAIWLCALATKPEITPRRLVYVVNRRTVVDQTTAEVERLCASLKQKPELSEIRNTLILLCALPLPAHDASPLAISTLRGQFADNGEWCTDPARPAVVVGTVDMIGSGLLFSRYTRGFKTRPLHAGFLAQDALLVHDEAHLEPCFQSLLETIVATQKAEAELRKLHVIALTATSRSETANNTAPFTLTAADQENETVQKRIHAAKRLSLIPLDAADMLDAKLVAMAKAKPAGRAVLVFTRSVAVALKVFEELNKGAHKGMVATLTGTMRGEERDALVDKNPVFQRFLPEKDRAKNIEAPTGTVFLVATSAGEVGVNLSADDLVCDLSTYESMAQRFGRVNRFGLCDDSEITVVHETKFESAKPIEAARARTLALLQQLDGSASPAALDTLPAAARAAAFSPPPTLREATDVQFDAWALTSIRKPIAARPPVAPYLHGETEWQPPETHLAWRDDRDFAHIAADSIEGFLETFPLHSRELLRDTSDRIFDTLGDLVSSRLQTGNPLPDAWLIDAFGTAEKLSLFPFALSAKSKKDRTKDEEAELKRLNERITEATLLLPASLGGLDPMGMFSASAKTPASDCSGIERRESDTPNNSADFSLIVSDEDAEEPRYLLWFAPLSEPTAKRRVTTTAAETLDAHTKAVTANAAAIAAQLFPESSAAGAPDWGRCLVVAASLHDVGKNRAQWQRNLGNLTYDPTNPATIFAKSGAKMRPRNVAEYYRHEFGSLLDAEHDPDFNGLTETEREIALHLVAAHHGRARPHFPIEESFDYSGNSAAAIVATDTPRRFARLQKRFGRWGLAWLESLLRAADYAASAGIVAPPAPPFRDRTPVSAPAARVLNPPLPAPTATLAVNPANPGHYFACCGLFELATRPRLFPDAVAWFEQTETGFRFHLANTPPLTELIEKITAAEITVAEDSASDDTDETDESAAAEENAEEIENEKEASAPPLLIGEPFDLRLDWWTTASSATSALKVWAGSMKVLGIARSMSYTVAQSLASYRNVEQILFEICPAYDPAKIAANRAKTEAAYLQALRKAEEKQAEALKKAGDEKSGDKLEKEKAKIAKKFEDDLLKAKLKRDSANLLKGAKKEPFYFDANRGPNSDARDVGFSPNDLRLETLAAPAAEFLTLVGLQRAIPEPSGDRLFDYHLWQTPVPIALLAAAINGLADSRPQPSFRFESWYRTSQRKHKAFLPGKPL